MFVNFPFVHTFPIFPAFHDVLYQSAGYIPPPGSVIEELIPAHLNRSALLCRTLNTSVGLGKRTGCLSLLSMGLASSPPGDTEFH